MRFTTASRHSLAARPAFGSSTQRLLGCSHATMIRPQMRTRRFTTTTQQAAGEAHDAATSPEATHTSQSDAPPVNGYHPISLTANTDPWEQVRSDDCTGCGTKDTWDMHKDDVSLCSLGASAGTVGDGSLAASAWSPAARKVTPPTTTPYSGGMSAPAAHNAAAPASMLTLPPTVNWHLEVGGRMLN